MTQPFERVDPMSPMWCGRSWQGLADRRSVAFAHALSLRDMVDPDADAAITSFLDFFATEGRDLFANEEDWAFDALTKNEMPAPVLKAYMDHLELSSAIDALISKHRAGVPHLDDARSVGERLAQHLLMEEEEIGPLLVRPSSSVHLRAASA